MYTAILRNSIGLHATSKVPLYSSSLRILHGRKSGLIQQSYRHFLRISPKTEERFKQEDHIPESFRLIYRAPNLKSVKIAQSVSTGSIIMLTLTGGSHLLKYGDITFPVIFSIENGLLGDITADTTSYALLISSFLLFNIAIYAVTLRYPYRMYHNEKSGSYICVLAALIPFTKLKKVSFKRGEIERAYSVLNTYLPWKDGIFKVGKKTLFLFENHFATPSEFSTMLRKI